MIRSDLVETFKIASASYKKRRLFNVMMKAPEATLKTV